MPVASQPYKPPRKQHDSHQEQSAAVDNSREGRGRPAAR